jgi:hypothetical protein
MASKKTSIFTLTERLTIDTAASDVTATIDIGSYVDVADRQGLQVHSVDYIVQGTTAAETLTVAVGGDSQVQVQLTDLNRGGLVFANDRALVSSMKLLVDYSNNATTMDSDLYPDNFGKGSDDGRYIVNDQLYLTGRASAVAANEAVNVTVRVNCSVVSLSAKDFMAIAIQSTAADN